MNEKIDLKFSGKKVASCPNTILEQGDDNIQLQKMHITSIYLERRVLDQSLDRVVKKTKYIQVENEPVKIEINELKKINSEVEMGKIRA
jgi:hypothetical protein